MEEGLPYKVEVFYDNYCVRSSDNTVLFITKGELYDQLQCIKINYNLYKFIDGNVQISET